MAGMDAFVDHKEREASINMMNKTLKCNPSKSSRDGTSFNEINLEGGCVTGMGDPCQETALSFCMASAEKEYPAPSIVAAGSSTSGMEDFTFPQCSKLCPQSVDPGIIGSKGQCLESCKLLASGKGFCHLMNESVSLENDKNLSDRRSIKEVQVCAICHEKIKTEETAEIKGCEHSYCVTCILRWATYKSEPWCPQCRLPFSFLYVYRALDGSLSDYLFEESVCLLLRAFWFKPLVVEEPEEQDDYQDDYDAFEEPYYTSNVRLGNRRWGGSGYVRTGRLEARPVGVRQVGELGSSSSRQAKGKEPAKNAVGRRARRTQKREQLDKVVENK